MTNAYEVLGIEPTQNVVIIKKAYIKLALQYHPDKNPDDIERATEKFKALRGAFDELNTEEKAKKYFSLHGKSHGKAKSQDPDYSDDSDDLDSSPAPAEAKTPTSFYNVPAESVDLRPFKVNEQIEVYIPVDLDTPHGWGGGLKINRLTACNRTEFGKGIDFQKIADFLLQESQKYSFQIGMTHKEATDIVNQHSHRYLILIIKVSLSVNDITFNRLNEKDFIPNLANPGKGSYFMLLQNTKFTMNNIISVSAMRDYRQTMRVSDNIDDFWPKGLTVYNPMYTSATPALTTNTNLLLSDAQVSKAAAAAARIELLDAWKYITNQPSFFKRITQSIANKMSTARITFSKGPN